MKQTESYQRDMEKEFLIFSWVEKRVAFHKG